MGVPWVAGENYQILACCYSNTMQHRIALTSHIFLEFPARCLAPVVAPDLVPGRIGSTSSCAAVGLVGKRNDIESIWIILNPWLRILVLRSMIHEWFYVFKRGWFFFITFHAPFYMASSLQKGNTWNKPWAKFVLWCFGWGWITEPGCENVPVIHVRWGANTSIKMGMDGNKPQWVISTKLDVG